MFTIDVTEPVNLLLILTATVLLIFLGRETKKAIGPAIALVLHLGLLVFHNVQIAIISAEQVEQYYNVLMGCLTIDFIMIFLSFIAYLWIDDLECKLNKKKSINNSLDWFWKKV